jgi:uncharacterized Zn-binding protein involved in type VI secretion
MRQRAREIATRSPTASKCSSRKQRVSDIGMKTIGWIRQYDKAACGGVVAEASITEKSHGRGYSFQGAAMSCKKGCTIAEGHPQAKLRNGKQRVVHGQQTTRGCALISTLNDIDGVVNASGANIADQFRQDANGNVLPIFLPRPLSACGFDQHVIVTDQAGQALEGVRYQLFDTRGAVIAGVTGPDGRTSVMGGEAGETLSFSLMPEEDA